MGHIHLGVLPSTKKWGEVVLLLEGGAPSDEVISAAGAAAETDLRDAANDPVFVETIRLLAAVPRAAAKPNFLRALRDLGVETSRNPDLLDLVSAIGTRLDDAAAQARRTTDFGELSRRALLATFTNEIGGSLPGLFQATRVNAAEGPSDVKARAPLRATALARLGLDITRARPKLHMAFEAADRGFERFPRIPAGSEIAPALIG